MLGKSFIKKPSVVVEESFQKYNLLYCICIKSKTNLALFNNSKHSLIIFLILMFIWLQIIQAKYKMLANKDSANKVPIAVYSIIHSAFPFRHCPVRLLAPHHSYIASPINKDNCHLWLWCGPQNTFPPTAHTQSIHSARATPI